MAGIGGQDAAGKLVTVQAELPGDVDGILEAIRKIILLGEVQSLTLKNDEPITYQRFVRSGEEIRPEESTMSYAEMSAYDIIRNIEMEEWDSGGAPPHTVLFWMFIEMATRDWVVTHVLLGEGTHFWEWLQLPAKTDRAISQFLGARIEKCKELPSGVFILCGAKTKQATIAEVGFALKGTAHEQGIDPEDN